MARRSRGKMADMTQTFTRMDESTAEQWTVIGTETATNQTPTAERVIALLVSLTEVTDGFAVDQLTHCLQTATRAERAGADDEVVIASLCHDIGKAVSVPLPLAHFEDRLRALFATPRQY
jgi:predicted HD phosphohydrolase